MPWAEQLPSGKWRAGWRDQIGRKCSKAGFGRKAEALRFAGEEESKCRRGEKGHRSTTLTWGKWCPIWLETRAVERSTSATDALRVEKYLKPRWEGARLNRISRSDVQAWVHELARTDLSAASIEKVVRLFSASMTAAVQSDTVPLAANPCSSVKLPRVAPGHERFLTRAEVDRIVYFLNEPYRTAVLLGAWTGLRWGELAGLHWQRVDLDARLIDVVEVWDRERIKLWPKGHNRRAVPIGDQLLPALVAARERAPQARDCGIPHARGGAKCRSGLVVPSPRGLPLNGQNFGRRQWDDACTLAKVGDARLHDLRHTFASWLVQDGVPLQEVQRLLGHASIVTTERYAHLGVSQNERVLAALR